MFYLKTFPPLICLSSLRLTSTLHHFVEFALDVQLWMFGFHTFQLDGYFISCSNVGTCWNRCSWIVRPKSPCLWNFHSKAWNTHQGKCLQTIRCRSSCRDGTCYPPSAPWFPRFSTHCTYKYSCYQQRLMRSHQEQKRGATASDLRDRRFNQSAFIYAIEQHPKWWSKLWIHC